MKNWYGILGGRRNRLHQSIDDVDRRSRDLHAPFSLVVVDATRVLMP